MGPYRIIPLNGINGKTRITLLPSIKSKLSCYALHQGLLQNSNPPTQSDPTDPIFRFTDGFELLNGRIRIQKILNLFGRVTNFGWIQLLGPRIRYIPCPSLTHSLYLSILVLCYEFASFTVFIFVSI